MQLGMVTSKLRDTRFQFYTASSVFSKRKIDLGTRLLIESMVLPNRHLVLDVGCGYGAVGIAAATFNPQLHVEMIDVNERAVWLTKKNIRLNKLKNVTVRQGYLYEPVNNLTFETILSNPPISAGMKIVQSIIWGAKKRLTSKGLFQIVTKSKIGKKIINDFLLTVYGNSEIIARRSGYRVFLSEKIK